MPTENTVTISVERFQQLIRAEHDANHLKALIADAQKNYDSFGRTEMNVLYKLFVGTTDENLEDIE